MDTWSFFSSGNDSADTLAKVGAALYAYTMPLSLSPLNSSQRLSLYTNWRLIIQSVFSNIKFLPYPLKTLLSVTPLAVLSRVCAATDTALFSLHASVGLVEPGLRAATVVLNHRTSFISYKTALHLIPFI